MRIVSLETWLSELAIYFEAGPELLGVDHLTAIAKPSAERISVTFPHGAEGTPVPELSSYPLNVESLLKLRPEVILCSIDSESVPEARRAAEDLLGYPVIVFGRSPRILKEVLETFTDVGKLIKRDAQAKLLRDKVLIQLKNLTDNFYDRLKSKRVSFLAEVAPPQLAGKWIPDLLTEISVQSQEQKVETRGRITSWQEIATFRPDVLVIAPRGESVEQAASYLSVLEKLPEWNQLPAVKRGEVVFCDGIKHFYQPGPQLIQSIAILVSAAAGLESGYITPRDVFYRLRHVELHRQKFIPSVKK